MNYFHQICLPHQIIATSDRSEESMANAAKQKAEGPHAEETCEPKTEAEKTEECLDDTCEGEEEGAFVCDQEVEAQGEGFQNL